MKRVVNTLLVQVPYTVGREKHENQGEAALKVTYDTRSKQLEQENRILLQVLSDKEIELEVGRELLKKKFGTSDPRKI